MHIKKLILFLFLVPVFASAQKTTGANYTYIAQRYEWLAGVFKALGLPAGDSAQFQPGQEMRAGAVYYDSTGANAGLYVYDGAAWQSVSEGVPYLNSTGLLSNGLLTINGGDNSKFDLAAGTGEVVDYATDPVNPSKINVSFGPFTAQTVTNIASADKTFIMINSSGAITQQTTFPTQQERRQKILVGAIIHPNHSTIQNARTIPDFVQGPGSQLYDFFDALGAFSVDGNRVSANGANLSFNKTAGRIFRRGANYQGDDQNPHVATLAAGTPQSFIKASVNAQIGGTVTVVDPANYDVAGTITPIPGGVNTSTIQRVYAFSSGLVFVQYGQTLFSSLSAAIAGIANEAFTINPAIADGGVLLAYIVLTKGCTDLSNAATAAILPAPRFDAGVGGGSSAVTSLQQAYNNSVTPQITTSTALGSFDIKRGSAADADAVVKVMNGAGIAVTTLHGSGDITATLSSAAGNKALRYNTSTGAVTYADTSAQAWAITGNAGTTAGTNFVGTTDAIDLVLKTNNTENLRFIQSTGQAVFSNSIQVGNGSGTVASVKFLNDGATNLGLYRSASNSIGVSVGSTEFYRFASSLGFVAGSGASIGLGNTVGSPDARLFRDAAGIMALRDQANSQEFRIYNTDATDDEYVSLGFKNTANVFTIESEKTGSGTIRDLEIKSGTANTRITKLAGTGTRLVTADASGNLATKNLITLTKNINLPFPTSAENEFIFFTPVAITVTNTRAVLVGSSTPSVTYNIGFGTDRTSLTNVYTAGQTVTSTTTGTDASGVNDNTIPANSWVVLTTSAQSGTVTAINASIQFTED